jgi:hypothetical protein
MLADSSLTSGGGVWMALAMLCAVSLILTQIRRAHARRGGREQFVRQQMDRLHDAREMRHSCDDIAVRLEDTGRRICAEIDTRFAKLECVVAEAETRAARLEALMAELRDSGIDPSQLAAASEAPQHHERANHLVHPGHGEAERSLYDTPVAPPMNDAPGSPPDDILDIPPDQAARTDALRERVYALADAGRRNIQIARELDMPLGEIELILNLRQFE